MSRTVFTNSTYVLDTVLLFICVSKSL